MFCALCGAENDSPRAKYCSGACRARASRQADPNYREKQKARQKSNYSRRCSVYYADCQFCGRLFCTKSPKSVQCGRDECRRAFNNRRMREGGWANASGHRRRVRQRAGEVESFQRDEIFERDGWVCGICEEAVDPALAHPAPMSKSLDHIVPVSLGGGHTRSNVRLAHLVCNTRRGNRAVML